MTPERLPAEILIEARDDDPGAAVGERERCVDDRVVEELHLVDPDDLVPGRAGDELRHALDRDGPHSRARMRDDVGDVVAVVDPRLEDDDRLVRKPAFDLGCQSRARWHTVRLG